MSGRRVLAGAACMGQVKVTAMGPTVFQTIVAASGSWGSGATLVVSTIVECGAGAGAACDAKFCVVKA